MTTKIYHCYYDDEFEHEGFVNENFEIISWWSMNDANWRGEYFDDMMRQLGYTVVYNDPERTEYFKEQVESEFGV